MRARHVHYSPVAPLPGEPDLFAMPALTDLAQDTFRALHGDVPSVSVDTSREAAARIRPHTARVREAIFLYIAVAGVRGMTAGEIANGTGLNPSTVRPRLLELQGKAKWAPGLPARIQRSPEARKHMRVYHALQWA